MKKVIYSLLTAALFCFSSCSDWLDVAPSTEKDRDDLIDTENGFKQMLYGTYINMISPSSQTEKAIFLKQKH